MCHPTSPPGIFSSVKSTDPEVKFGICQNSRRGGGFASWVRRREFFQIPNFPVRCGKKRTAKIPGGEVGLQVGFAAGNIFACPGALQTPYLFNQGELGVVPLQADTWHGNGVFYQTEIGYELLNASKTLNLPETRSSAI